MTADPDGSPSDSQTVHTRNTRGSYEGPKVEEPVAVAVHVADVAFFELPHDHPLAKGVRNVDQGTENVDLEIHHVENLLDQRIESLDNGSHTVDHEDL